MDYPLITANDLPPQLATRLHVIPTMIGDDPASITVGSVLDLALGAPPEEFDTLQKLVEAIGVADLAGPVIATTVAAYTTNADLSASIPLDDTKPQISEGVQILSLSITPKRASNKLRCLFVGAGTVTPAGTLIAAMFNGAADAIAATPITVPTAGNSVPVVLQRTFDAGVVTPITISVRVGAATGVARMNGNASARLLGGAALCTLLVQEILA